MKFLLLAFLIPVFILSANAEEASVCKAIEGIEVCFPEDFLLRDRGRYIELDFDVIWDSDVNSSLFYDQQTLQIIDVDDIDSDYQKCAFLSDEDLITKSYCELNPINYYKMLSQAFSQKKNYTYPNQRAVFSYEAIGDNNYMRAVWGVEGAPAVTHLISFIDGKMIFFKIVTIGDGYQIDSKKLNSYIPQFTFATSIFPDIPTTHPNYQAIQYVQEQGIVQGYEDPSDSSGQAALYKPDNPINRAEFTKILIGASVHTSTVTGNNCFPDVQDQWFAPFVCTAKAHNIVAGNPDGTFLPAANINTAEAAKIIVHTFHLPVPPGLPSDPWYTSYITALTAANALPQTAAKPDHILTRAEMAEMMYRIAQ